MFFCSETDRKNLILVDIVCHSSFQFKVAVSNNLSRMFNEDPVNDRRDQPAPASCIECTRVLELLLTDKNKQES